MKLTCNRQELSSAVTNVQRAVSTKASMPVLEGVLIAAENNSITFTGYNLGNSCDVWFIHTFKNVPVFVTIIVSLIAGVVITLPFTMGRRVTREDKKILKADKKAKKIQAKQEKKDKKAKKPVTEPSATEDNSLAPDAITDGTADSALLPESSSIEYSDSEHIPSEAD